MVQVKSQILLPSNVIEISPQGFKFCNSVEKYQIFVDGNNVGFYLNHSHILPNIRIHQPCTILTHKSQKLVQQSMF